MPIGIKAQFRWHSQRNRNLGISPALAITSESNKVKANFLESMVRYNDNYLAGKLFLNSYFGFSYYDTKNDNDGRNFLLYPAGSFDNTFPDGVIFENWTTETFLQAHSDVTYSDNHNQLTIGMGYNKLSILRNEYRRNFESIDRGIPIPSNGIQVYTVGSGDFLNPDRRNYYLFAQNEWRIYQTDIDLILGIRGDRYSDFGDFYSPRSGLVWNFSYNTTIKLLYGRAFKAPSYSMLFSPGAGGVLVGNRNLKPQSTDMTQAVIIYHPTLYSTFEYSVYYYVVQNLMDIANNRFFNDRTNQTGYGTQVEYAINFDEYDIRANYSFQQAKTESGSVAEIFHTPTHMAHIRIHKYLFLNYSSSIELIYAGRQVLSETHNPNTFDSYYLLNTKISYNNRKIDVELIIKNILNKTAYTDGSFLPNGIRLPKRSFIFKLVYSYD